MVIHQRTKSLIYTMDTITIQMICMKDILNKHVQSLKHYILLIQQFPDPIQIQKMKNKLIQRLIQNNLFFLRLFILF